MKANVKRILTKISTRRDDFIRGRPELRRREEIIGHFGEYIVYLYGAFATPILFLHAVLYTSPKRPDGDIHLDPARQVTLLAVIVVSVIFSPVLGGYARLVFDRFKRRISILAPVVLFGALLAYASYAVRGITAELDVSKTDHALVVSVMVTWLFTTGYVCKVPWDRARDLFFIKLDRRSRLQTLRLERRLRRPKRTRN